MICTHVFDLAKSATFYVVSTPETINNLRSFAGLHHANGTLTAEVFFDRIMFHNAYCCISPNSLSARPLVKALRKALKQRGRLIDLDTYFEAFVLYNPEEASSVEPLPTEELIAIVEESEWNLVFEINKNDLIARIKRMERD